MMAKIEIDSQKPVMGERFFLAVILILIFAMAARTPLDTDMWWHLRAGEQTWQTGWPVTVDTFSYTRQGETWINHSWLSQLAMYLVYRLGGFPGLGAMVALLAAISMALVYAQMEGHPLMRAFVLILASAVAAPVWSPRPQLVSLLMFGVTGYILYLFKWRRRNYLWLLLLVFVLWSNLHGGYVLGLLLLAGMLAGEVLNHLLGNEGGQVVPWEGIGRLTLWGLAAALVVVINPNGLAMWTIPFRTVGVQVLRNFIPEWASPDFHDPVQQPFLWLLFGIFGAVAASHRRMDGTDLVSLIGFAYLALVARRNFGPFAMVAAPVFSRHLSALLINESDRLGQLVKRITKSLFFVSMSSNRKGLSPGISKILNFVIIGLLAAAAAVKLDYATSPALVSKNTEAIYPNQAVDWIRVNRPPGRMFNSYNWGGYLDWTLPDYQVFVDGRTDLYNDDLLKEYLQVAAGENGWESTLDDYGVNLVFVEQGSGLAKQLEHDREWVKAYRDEKSVVLIRKNVISLRQ
jgi:hypothetical protein